MVAMYVVILAGGGGTRLWPLSRPERPKPFMPLLGEESLLQRTAARLLEGGRLGIRRDDLTVVTDRRYADLVRQQLPGVHVLAEPGGRNTAAAIALATLAIERPSDEVMVVLPADHRIEREDEFRRVLGVAAGSLATGAFGIEDPLVTLGIRPTEASTQYGWILPRLDRGGTIDGLEAYPVARFEEKPKAERADELFGMPGAAWNAGMFLWRRRAIEAALSRYTGLLTLLRGSLGSETLIEDAYNRVHPISIDYAVLEGAASDGRVVTGAMDVGWSDLGSWSALLDALGIDCPEARVVQTGEGLDLAEDDLVVQRVDGDLILQSGPGSRIVSDQPMAHLPGVAAAADSVRSLLDRVHRQEG